jgi:protein phosphatase
MSPVETSQNEGWLERPEEAFEHYRAKNISEVVCEEKHMGSRALILVCRDGETAKRRFGASQDEAGAIWTRTGRAFFNDPSAAVAVLDRVRTAADKSGLWAELKTDWILFDVEIMPWSAKASGLIESQYAPVAASATAGLSAALEASRRAGKRGLDTAAIADRLDDRLSRARKYSAAWAPYVWQINSVDDLRVAPFHILASEGAVHSDKPHVWHMGLSRRLSELGGSMMHPTEWRSVRLDDPAACAAAIAWWEELVLRGGEGMVVKPADFLVRGEKGLVQPALKVRGPEYLRIIYGPEYDAPENIARLRSRGLSGKRALALREFSLGLEALERFVAHEPLRRVHECVFGVLALESEPVDPRL